MSTNPELLEAVEEAGLHYTTDRAPGIVRLKSGDRITYRSANGRAITKADRERIDKLAIPPAYESVWICADSNGHLQATGIDARGRKQYRYHPRFRELRDESKFGRMLEFGRALPEIRSRVDRDLAKHGLPKEKVLAAVVYLLERSLIRVGNAEYAKQNGSFGLTTLRNRHVKIEGSRIEFNFLGKSRVKHRIEVHDRRLARAIKKIQDLPGQELFQYLNEEGEAEPISSSAVNAYLHEVAGQPFTAKDFRTWWGTVLAMTEFMGQEEACSKRAAKLAISAVMKSVSRQLGNTPAICRKCYVHPCVVRMYVEGGLGPILQRIVGEADGDMRDLAEMALIELLSQ